MKAIRCFSCCLLLLFLAFILLASTGSAQPITGLAVSKNTANTTDNVNGGSGNASRGQVLTTVAVESSSATSFTTRYASTLDTDTGNQDRTEILDADYTISFDVTTPGAYFLTVESSLEGAFTLVEESSGKPGLAEASMSAIAGVQTGGTVAGGSLNVDSPGSLSGTLGGNSPFSKSSSGQIDGVSNGSPSAHTLTFTWQSSCRSKGVSGASGDECAVRLGLPNSTDEFSSFTAGNYPGVGGRVADDDGHFVTVTVHACGDGVIDEGNPGEQCDDGLLNGTTASCCAADCSFKPSGALCPVDGNECTDDVCDGEGTCVHLNNSAPCTDGVFCNGFDTCGGGSCSVHSGDPCIAGSECSDTCNEDADNCDDPMGTACSDDGNVCTNNVCNGEGDCGVNNTAPCDDGNFCNGPDYCDFGSCSRHDGDPCNGGGECNDYCNEEAETCHSPLGTVCSDDENVCTDDECDGSGACVHPDNSDPCNDGVFCNGSDSCEAGACSVHTGDPCAEGGECNSTCNEESGDCFDPAGVTCADDGNVCTDDECDGEGSCAHPNNSDPCDDGLFCTENESCDGGSCGGGTAIDCSAFVNECNDGVCNEAIDECESIPNSGQNGASCDEDGCNTDGVCLEGECQGTSPVTCFDDDHCTSDVCDPIRGCAFDVNVESYACQNCEDAEDNDGDGDYDARDSDCASLYFMQDMGILGTRDKGKSVLIGQKAEIESCQVGTTQCDPVTTPVSQTDGVCNLGTNLCECPPSQPFCQPVGLTCLSDEDCVSLPYPTGVSGASVCGESKVQLSAWNQIAGYLAGADNHLIRIGVGTDINIGTLLVAGPTTSFKIKQNVEPVIGPGVCIEPDLITGSQIPCTVNAHCVLPETCEGLFLTDPANVFPAGAVDLTATHPKYIECDEAQAQLDVTTPGTVAEQLLNLGPADQTYGRVKLKPGQPQPFAPVSGPGPHIIEVDRITVNSLTNLVLTGDPDSVLVIKIAKSFVVRKNAQVTLAGGLRAKNVVFLVTGTSRVHVVGALDTEFHGTILKPLGKVTLGKRVQFYGAVGARDVKVNSDANVHHVPFTGYLGCGDLRLNHPDEECDGADDAACPGACNLDCTCP